MTFPNISGFAAEQDKILVRLLVKKLVKVLVKILGLILVKKLVKVFVKILAHILVKKPDYTLARESLEIRLQRLRWNESQ